MNNFKWYDYVVIYFVSDMGSVLIMAMLSGLQGAVIMVPLLVLAWLSYENFRSTRYDKEPD